MSATTVKLLHAAAEVSGGTKALASRLGISEALLCRFLADRRELPDALFLRAVDIVLEDRPCLPSVAAQPAAVHTGVPQVAESVKELQNCVRESGAAEEAGTAG